MKLAVNDACVLIDLLAASLLDLWIQTDVETWIAEPVLMELYVREQEQLRPYIEARRLMLRQFSADELATINVIHNSPRCRGLSFQDASCLFLAKEEKMLLLSGDAALRKRATAFNIEVHGTLWIFQFLVDSEILIPELAITKLETLLSLGRRLPEEECRRFIHKWRTKSD